jgi:hypothetical protein
VRQVKDAIGPDSADHMMRGISSAADTGAPVVILIDTPGGLGTSMRQIIQAMLASEGRSGRCSSRPPCTFLEDQARVGGGIAAGGASRAWCRR